MKLLVSSVVSALLGFSAAQAADMFPQSVYCAPVTVSTKDTINTITSNITEKRSNHIGNQIALVDSFHALNEAIVDANPVEICASAVDLAKVDLNYVSLFVFQAKLANGSIRRFNYLAYTVSVQAHHNVGINPWGGIAKKDLERKFVDLFSGLGAMDDVTTESNLNSVFMKYFGMYNLHFDASSIVPVLVTADAEYHFATTVAEIVSNPNPFLQVEGTRGILLKKSGGRWYAAPYADVYGLYNTVDESIDDLSKMRDRSKPELNTTPGHQAQLLKISQ